MSEAEATSVAQALEGARARGVDRLDAQLLLAAELGRPRSWLLAHGDETLAPSQAQAFAARCAERAAGVPLAYLLGEKEFRGLTLEVDRASLALRGFTVVDEQDAVSKFRLAKLQENRNLPDSEFVFTMPKGVEIRRQ